MSCAEAGTLVIDLSGAPEKKEGMRVVFHNQGGLHAWDPRRFKAAFVRQETKKRHWRSIDAHRAINDLIPHPMGNIHLMNFLAQWQTNRLTPLKGSRIYFPATQYRIATIKKYLTADGREKAYHYTQEIWVPSLFFTGTVWRKKLLPLGNAMDASCCIALYPVDPEKSEEGQMQLCSI